MSAITFQGLSRRFGGHAAVSDLDLEIESGSVFGFLGPNGAGKTTTVRMMLGLLRPSGGSLKVLGLDPIADGERLRSQTGVLLDQVGLYDRLTAWQNLDLFGRIARMGNGERRAKVEAALRRVDLWDRRADHVSGFSKGMRQKLGIARALLADPQLLIMDEPTSGLDPVNIKMLRDLLTSLAAEGGRTIFMCTHQLDEAQRICSQVGIIRAGRLVAVGAPDKLEDGDSAPPRVRVQCSRPAAAREAALPAGAQMDAPDADGWLRITLARPEDAEALVKALVEADAGVLAVVPERRSLEDVYLSVVEGG
jgi:ABC-2 type transport system ATP-binding protein